ncbi:MAG: ChbG/HpnK family deacetylase [Anaerolineae bacterium]
MAKAANPVLRRLGLSGNDRALVIQAAEVGMCHATLPAFSEVMAFGLVTSGSLMVPSPWFPQAAALCRDHPGWDVGVHATVTSEWLSCRWRPLSTLDPDTGLVDEDGYLPRQAADVRERAEPDPLYAEIKVQITRALAAGIDVTHLDQHMFAFSDPRTFPPYAEAAVRFHVPPILLRSGDYARRGVSLETARVLEGWGSEMEELGWPVFDSVQELPLRDPEGQVAITRKMIDGLGPGLHLIVLHPAIDTPELRAMVPNWQARVANREAMLSVGLRDHVRLSGVRLIGFRELRRAAGKK